jgi:hypothetical protein
MLACMHVGKRPCSLRWVKLERRYLGVQAGVQIVTNGLPTLPCQDEVSGRVGVLKEYLMGP